MSRLRTIAALTALVALAGCGTAAPAATASPTANPTARPTVPTVALAAEGPAAEATEEATVTRVIDGDTIEVVLKGETFTVRYIGIDTPETKAPDTPIEFMGPEAEAANAGLVDGATVYLERDVSETDQYGRLLRYVWLDRGDKGWLLVNLRLVERGFAQVSTFPPDVRYQDLFVAAQRTAREGSVGLWGDAPTAEPVVTAKPTAKATKAPTAKPTKAPTAKPTKEPASDCDPSYPGVCIPPYPPDLDCGDIPYRRFDVIGSDPHGFDGDGDGIGCESG
jgi:micrococcal nuclease